MHYEVAVLFVSADEIHYPQKFIENLPGAIGIYKRPKQLHLYIGVQFCGYNPAFVYIKIKKGPDRAINVSFKFGPVQHQ